MKIAMIVKNYINNGIGTVVFNYSSALSKLGHNVDIIVSEEVAENKYIASCNAGLRVIKLPSKSKSFLKYYCALYRILKHGNYNLAHIHGNSGAIFPEICMSKLARLAVVCHCHNTQCNHIIIHKLFRRLVSVLSNERIACSKAAGKWLFGNYDFQVLPNAFQTEHFRFNEHKRTQIRKVLGIGKDTLVIGNVARLNQQKNQAFLIRVFAVLHRIYPDSRLVIVGDGPERKNLKKQACISKIMDSTIFYGVESDPSGLYSAFDVFAFPSFFEGLGISLIEAQISGLPCVVADTVPEEAQISKRFTRLSLIAGEKVWAKELCKFSDEKDSTRTLASSKCDASCYEISNCIIKLIAIYEKTEAHAFTLKRGII